MGTALFRRPCRWPGVVDAVVLSGDPTEDPAEQSTETDPARLGAAGGLDQRGQSSMATYVIKPFGIRRLRRHPSVGADHAPRYSTSPATGCIGSPGDLPRSMIGMALVKSLYALPTWTLVAGASTNHMLDSRS